MSLGKGHWKWNERDRNLHFHRKLRISSEECNQSERTVCVLVLQTGLQKKGTRRIAFKLHLGFLRRGENVEFSCSSEKGSKIAR